MSSANDPSAPQTPPETSSALTAAPPTAPEVTAIQATPPADSASITLPPPPAAKRTRTPEQIAAEIARLDGVLVFLVLVLAFLTGSFTARNNDLWMHLASGRLLAQGQVPWGVDPFAYASSGYWVNPSWLYDGLLYGLSSLAGGIETPTAQAVLIIFKALLLTALAEILLRIRRPGQSLWAPAACTALAILALSPRALLQPAVVSFLFLGATLYLLNRPSQVRARQPEARTTLTAYWLLPPLFALWANFDQWFLLGPITVALYLLGEVLQKTFAPLRTGPDAPEPTEPRTLLLVLLVGTAACLLNPQHYHVFTTLPAEVYSSTLNILHTRDPNYINFSSALSNQYLRASAGLNPAGLAYFLLLGLGLLSFALTFGAWRISRLTVWFGFALLSLAMWRCIPFFAVVAGPIAALNLQDYAARHFGLVPRVDRAGRQWALGGRLATLLAGVALLALTWLGLLQANPSDPRSNRHFAWSIEVDPSLRQAALQLKEWRDQGRIGKDDYGFNYSPDVANYLAWFCPEEKAFFDTRFALFTSTVGTWADMRLALRGNIPRAPDDPTKAPPDSTWQRVFRDEHHRINHLVVSQLDTHPDSLLVTYRLLNDPNQWSLIYADGRTFIYAWKDPTGKDAGRREVARLDLQARAFGKEAVRAPAAGPEPVPRGQEWWEVLKLEWWDKYTKAPARRPLAAEEVIFYLEYFNQMAHPQRAPLWKVPALLAAHWAIWTGARAAGWTTPDTVTGPALAAWLTPMHPKTMLVANQGAGPPAPLYLALRASRHALQESPDFWPTYLYQARIYDYLSQGLEGSWAANRLGRLGFLRQVQQVAALERARSFQPDDAGIHSQLHDLYRRIGFLDFALEHLTESLRLIRLAGKQPGESQKDFDARMEKGQDLVKDLDTEVQRRRNEYDVQFADKAFDKKLQAAYRYGLQKKALELLRQPHTVTDQNKPLEADMLALLLLFTGQVEELTEGLSDAQSSLGANYAWYSALLAAATGNYQRAGEYLDVMIASQEGQLGATALALMHGQSLQGKMQWDSLMLAPGFVANQALDLAGLRTVRGVLALEQGDTATAARFFDLALELTPSDGFRASGPEFDGRAVAQRYRALLKEAGQ